MNYAPPSENLPIFDPSVFLTGDEPLTYNIASKKFLKYPSAQGLENLQAINVNGVSTFNAEANFNKPITMTGLAIDRVISSTNYNIIDANTDAVSGVIVGISNNLIYDNNVNSGQHIFKANSSAGAEQIVEILDANGVSLNKPLTMTGSTANDRLIRSTYFAINNTSFGSVGNIYAVSNDIIYDNNRNTGKHIFKSSDGSAVESTIMTMDTTNVLVYNPFVSSNANPVNRVIGTTSYQILDTTAGITSMGLIECEAGNNNISYTNTKNSGFHNFYATTSGGVLQNPVSINTDGIILNTAGDYIQYPDGTKQYTAPILATYTEFYPSIPANLPSKTITIPANCYAIDIQMISGGGNKGANNGAFTGGTGGGGQIVRSNKIAVTAGQQFIVNFATDGAGNFIRGANGNNNAILLRSPQPNEAGGTTASIEVNGVMTSFQYCIATLVNGLNGGNATASANGVGAAAGSTVPAPTPLSTVWDGLRSTGGFTGGALTITGGAPRGMKWVAGGYGMGAVDFWNDTAGNAVLQITYYFGI